MTGTVIVAQPGGFRGHIVPSHASRPAGRNLTLAPPG
jgi:hypothetical protein